MTMADRAAENIEYFASEVRLRIAGFRATPKRGRRKTYLKARLKDLAYWAEYLIPLLDDLTKKDGK